MEKVRSASQLRQAEAARDAKRKLNKDKKRIAELDTIIKKLYESFAVGRITEERFDSLLADYENEQKTLQVSVTEAEEKLSAFAEDTARVEQFLELARKYTDFSELTTPMINEFIEKIIVHAPERIDGDRVQEVEIHLRFIGQFELPVPELTEEGIKRQEFLKKLKAEPPEVSESVVDIKRVPKVIESVEMTKAYLIEEFTAALQARDRASNDRYGSVIRDAKEYIRANFSQSDLSLNRIAVHIGVSPSYFSSIFKQETGQSFVEYLTQVRMERACELLKCTSYRTSEIGEQVGYNDSHYFSAAFKKAMGQSPKEYKASQTRQE
jgi:YesN/AraC family two-component response regulator